MYSNTRNMMRSGDNLWMGRLSGNFEYSFEYFSVLLYPKALKSTQKFQKLPKTTQRNLKVIPKVSRVQQISSFLVDCENSDGTLGQFRGPWRAWLSPRSPPAPAEPCGTWPG